MKKNITVIIIAIMGLIMMNGCELFKEGFRKAITKDHSSEQKSEDPMSDDYEARFSLGFFSIVRYPRAKTLEREIQGLDGQTVWINTNQNLGSKNILEAKVVSRPGNPELNDLRLKLDRIGKLQWQIMAGRHFDRPVALVIDGIYFCSFIPEMPRDDEFEWVVINAGLDPVTAKGVAKFAKRNYTFYNPDTKPWF